MKRWRHAGWLGLLLLGLLLLKPLWGLGLKPDETFMFFPTFGSLEEEGWLVDVHGWIYEPESSQAIEPLLRRGLELKEDKLTAEERQVLSQRLALFLADSERGKTIRIRLGGQEHLLGPSEANGHVQAQMKLPRADPAPDSLSGELARGGALTLQAVLDEAGRRKIDGTVLLVPPHGISIVSDIDDTIKISQVRNREALIQNTFLRVFRPVAGMAGLYRQWQTNTGVAFHYVSASPWQLIAPLNEFLQGEGFPSGSMHLQMARIKDGSFLQLLGDHDDHKLAVIEGVIRRFPGRRFVLVGDSGERDPEIYGELARRFPGRVTMVLIRDVTGEREGAERYGTAFRMVPRGRWQIFGDGTELGGRDLETWLSKAME